MDTFRIFTEKSQEYDLDNHDLFIGSKSATPINYSVKQEISFNLGA